eukprot:7148581-Alexandrium_andersonii.AAC.1
MGRDGANVLDEVKMIKASDIIKQRKAMMSRVEAVVEAETGETEAGSSERDQRSLQQLQPMSHDYF